MKQDLFLKTYNRFCQFSHLSQTLTGSCLCDLAFDQLRNSQNISGNYSACKSLNAFLNNGNPTGYDWRNAINSTRMLALGIAEFGGVSAGVQLKKQAVSLPVYFDSLVRIDIGAAAGEDLYPITLQFTLYSACLQIYICMFISVLI